MFDNVGYGLRSLFGDPSITSPEEAVEVCEHLVRNYVVRISEDFSALGDMIDAYQVLAEDDHGFEYELDRVRSKLDNSRDGLRSFLKEKPLSWADEQRIVELQAYTDEILTVLNDVIQQKHRDERSQGPVEEEELRVNNKDLRVLTKYRPTEHMRLRNLVKTRDHEDLQLFLDEPGNAEAATKAVHAAVIDILRDNDVLIHQSSVTVETRLVFHEGDAAASHDDQSQTHCLIYLDLLPKYIDDLAAGNAPSTVRKNLRHEIAHFFDNRQPWDGNAGLDTFLTFIRKEALTKFAGHELNNGEDPPHRAEDLHADITMAIHGYLGDNPEDLPLHEVDAALKRETRSRSAYRVATKVAQLLYTDWKEGREAPEDKDEYQTWNRANKEQFIKKLRLTDLKSFYDLYENAVQNQGLRPGILTKLYHLYEDNNDEDTTTRDLPG